ncbi:methyl-accepting chemotaxis protein [Elioraea thermophila]|uniref:methyl-accepting chemotaxis protein n=1 Tax=Elioraea thermophila TaxID=2185104 RepID=UPI000DF31965|nr:methyl-accepting chemotaxis protein [Elioraea thermophila]
MKPSARHALVAGLAGLRRRFGLATQVVVSGVVVTAAAVALLTWLKVSEIAENERQRAQANLEMNLRALKDQVHRFGREFRVDGDRLLVGETALNGRNDLVDAVRDIAGGVATLFLGDLRIATNVVRPDGSRGVGTRLAPGPAYDASITRGQIYRGENEILGRRHLTIYEPIRDASGRQIGLWFVGVPIDQIDAVVAAARREAILVGLAVIAAVALALWLVIRTSLRPVLALRDATLKVAEGDTEAPVPGTDRGDVVGALARAVVTLQERTREAKAAREQVEAERARNAEERRQQRLELAGRFEREVMAAVAAATEAAQRLRLAADQIAAGAKDTEVLSGSVASASERAAGGVQAVAAAAEELSASIREISRQVTETASAARSAAEESERTNAQVAELAQAASRIGDVVRLINDIAGQTNLLALNATIEAARAGEAGKGFAVVASEVKNLASQTAKATEEIATQISAMQAATDGAVGAIKAIGNRIDEISRLASAVAAAVEEQGVATAEIARSVQDAAAATSEVSQAMRQLSANVERAAAGGEAARSESARMAEQTGTVRRAVETFLGHLRAA